MKKRFILIITLLIAVGISTYQFQELFCRPADFNDEDRLTFFHNEPKNSMDIVVMGSSDVYAGYSAATAYTNYNITSYPYAISGSTVVTWKGMLEDIMATQKPKLVVVEPFGACYDDMVLRERSSQSIKLLDTMNFSARKIRLAREMSNRVEGSNTFDFLFPFIKFHNRYGSYVRNYQKQAEIKKINISPLKGVSNYSRISRPHNIYDARNDNQTMELGSGSYECLIEFLDYAKANNINIVFAKFPQIVGREGDEQHKVLLRANKIGEIASEYGYSYINLEQHWDEIGLETYGDFYNMTHLNVFGQKKVTDYLCQYLISEHNLEVSPKKGRIKKNWDKAEKYYTAYTAYSAQQIERGIKENLGDSPEDLKKLTRYMKENNFTNN